MSLRDLAITPIHFSILILLAYAFRNFFTDSSNRRLFIPALMVRLIGALALGFVYQFYYKTGDTFTYWEHGSHWIWEAFLDNPIHGLKLIFGNIWSAELFEYTNNIWVARSDSGMFVVRVAGFFDLLTFHTYSATALYFGLIGFSGSWFLFTTLSRKYPTSGYYLKLFILFFPSIIIWGSGIMKDTLTFAATCWLLAAIIQLNDKQGNRLFNVGLVIIATLILIEVKLYILLSLVPTLFLWKYFTWSRKIKNSVLSFLLTPILLICFILPAYFLSKQIGELNPKYEIDNLANRSMITANDIRYWSGKDSGSGYAIGQHDGTWLGMIKMAPQGIIVSLFRPFIWEVNNPLMLLSALESFLIAYLFIRTQFWRKFFIIRRDPFLLFTLIFILIFAFAVGVSTFNFGTLVRYRIPLFPFVGVLLGQLNSKEHLINWRNENS